MRAFVAAIMACIVGTNLAKAEINVATSIKPIHSLVSAVMKSVGSPTLIVNGANSPHTYNLKPSDAAILQKAQVIFWVGHELEPFLEKPIAALGEKARIIPLLSATGVQTLPIRNEAEFASHLENEEHNHDAVDGHIWLDPENAKAILNVVAHTLAEVDRENATTYLANAQNAAGEIDLLTAEIRTMLKPARGQGYLVFHDAYHYFEKRFESPASGAISINPENAPGAAAISKLKDQISRNKIKCVFSEPQFDNELTTLLLEGSISKTAVLDPLGANLDPGPELYPKLLRNLASTLSNCLTTP